MLLAEENSNQYSFLSPSVVEVLSFSIEGVICNRGIGTIIGENFVVTSRHVVSQQTIVGDGQVCEVEQIAIGSSLYFRNQPAAEVVDQNGDVALLHVADGFEPSDVSGFQLCRAPVTNEQPDISRGQALPGVRFIFRSDLVIPSLVDIRVPTADGQGSYFLTGRDNFIFGDSGGPVFHFDETFGGGVIALVSQRVGAGAVKLDPLQSDTYGAAYQIEDLMGIISRDHSVFSIGSLPVCSTSNDRLKFVVSAAGLGGTTLTLNLDGYSGYLETFRDEVPRLPDVPESLSPEFSDLIIAMAASAAVSREVSDYLRDSAFFPDGPIVDGTPQSSGFVVDLEGLYYDAPESQINWNEVTIKDRQFVSALPSLIDQALAEDSLREEIDGVLQAYTFH